MAPPDASRTTRDTVLVPFGLMVDPIARFANCELADHPVYDGIEVQRFDDTVHGTGMLVFLSRREDQTVDVYVEPELRLDREMFVIGGGIRSWQERDLGASRLEVVPDGVCIDVRFTDCDGRSVEFTADDRDGSIRKRASVLAPVSDGIQAPRSMLVVHMTSFDLVRTTGEPPVVRIDGEQVATGQLPAQRLHRRALVKYAADLAVARLNPDTDGTVPQVDRLAPGHVELDATGRVAGLAAATDGATAHLRLRPALPDLRDLPDGRRRAGQWRLDVAGARITGGTWTAERHGDDVDLVLEVTRRWQPPRLPLVMEVVTRVVPTFRQWPTTYRWTATVSLDEPATITASWERVGERSDAYRRATSSS